MTLADGLDVWLHFLALSLMAVGGAITTTPDMHRYLVEQHQWLSDAQFSSSIALAQAAPGPNVLFVALLGWNLGINAVGGVTTAGVMAYPAGLVGVGITFSGILLPSTTVALLAARALRTHTDAVPVRAFKQGLAPVVIALLLATGWLLARGAGASDSSSPYALSAVSVVLIWRTRIHLLWLLAAGALLGALGFV